MGYADTSARFDLTIQKIAISAPRNDSSFLNEQKNTRPKAGNTPAPKRVFFLPLSRKPLRSPDP
ncbi:hypothetical protein BAR24_03855 [Gluconobacter oxydans]|uniref:Uncharacterized protein n=1 Tax=Gluconobacter thailandicus NBRC 3257 TaxID=1381097 RepID=A0ABQ0IW27_GLUTH|nr:hypothetical protein B932_1035 [Gluconobacter oxydans H24]ANQ40679.1 hypothetical protein BAR24_03855 [Gluconobacter oxydans]GAC87829.1 hypothetical protein NBRC3255_1490 [Gluconobacter thailandicus NBRC 3255]GAD26408.1 hypothetical protein NBRC3257_1407 [Gluconobacter thailandicus NBRC 3257]